MTPRPCGGLSHAVYGPGEAVIIVAHPLAAAAVATLEGAVREVIDVQPGRRVTPPPWLTPPPALCSDSKVLSPEPKSSGVANPLVQKRQLGCGEHL